jgi:hypothetical protein
VGVPGAEPFAPPPPPPPRGRFGHLRLGGGGIVVFVLYLCVKWSGEKMLRAVLVGYGRRNTERGEASENENERSGRQGETSFIIFGTQYIHASRSTQSGTSNERICEGLVGSEGKHWTLAR